MSMAAATDRALGQWAAWWAWARRPQRAGTRRPKVVDDVDAAQPEDAVGVDHDLAGGVGGEAAAAVDAARLERRACRSAAADRRDQEVERPRVVLGGAGRSRSARPASLACRR